MIRRCLTRWPLVIAVLAVVASSLGQAELPGKGTIHEGSLLLRCFAPTCQLTVPVAGVVALNSNRVRVVPGHPGGVFSLAVITDSSSYVGEYAICGREAVIDVLPAGLRLVGEPCPPMGVLKVDGLPPSARFSLDGDAVLPGVDGVINTYAGERELRIELDGYEPYVGRFTVGDRERIVVSPVLVGKPGVLVLELPTQGVRIIVDDELWVDDGDSVRVEDAVMDHAASAVSLRLAPGSRTLRIARPRHAPVELIVDVAPGSIERRAVALVELPGIVTFRVSPDDATLVVDGHMVETGVAVEFVAGEVNVVATAPGYETYEATIEVLPGREAGVAIELGVAPVGVRLVGLPPGALLELESGEVIDANTRFLEMPGKRRFRVTADGYEPLQLEIELVIGAAAHVEARMKRLAYVAVVTFPTAAAVTIGGSERSERRIPLAAGTYDVRVSADGHEPWEERIQLSEGEARLLEVRLSPMPSWVFVGDLPAGTSVTVNGRISAVDGGSIGPLAAGNHVLAFEGPAHQLLVRRLWMEPGRDVDLRALPFVWRPATIELLGLPAAAEARIKVGDREVVRYVGPFEVPSGRHVVWVAADGVGRVQLTIDVGPGERVSVPVRFD